MAYIVQRLISAGHHLETVLEFTLAQARAFIAAIEQVEREKMYVDALVCRAAQYDGKSFESFLRSIE